MAASDVCAMEDIQSGDDQASLVKPHMQHRLFLGAWHEQIVIWRMDCTALHVCACEEGWVGWRTWSSSKNSHSVGGRGVYVSTFSR